MTDPGPDTDEAGLVVETLGLRPHPEGGWYAETWRARAAPGERPAGSAILFLLRAGETSRWHRVDADELWHHYAGAPIELRFAGPDALPATKAGAGPAAAPDGAPAVAPSTIVLGSDVLAGERPQAVVPAHAWQTARSLGTWTLVGCTVSPAFTFDGFELAPAGWRPRGEADGAGGLPSGSSPSGASPSGDAPPVDEPHG